ncbi:hypothetical protein MYXO_03871 [Myxococcaceae bacterium]|nr:hypothetical protein MYXO_03871 [Myxococcaceae bacterium]
MRILAHAAALVIGLATAVPAAAYPVGRVSVSFQDPARGNRNVGVELYYPATVAGSGAPFATPPEGGFPTVVFGHGFQMVVTAYENIWTALVPEGYVVALPTTGGELFPNHGDFGADLAFVVEKLRAESSNPASFLHQKLSGKAAVMGHSMGGGASFIAADVNATVDGIAVLAPAETNPSAIGAAAGITVPTLVFSGTKDCVASASQHQLPMYDASASTCKTYVSVAGGSHCQFGINNTLCNLGELFCGGAGISRAAQHAIVSSLLLPWLDGVLRSDWQRWQDFEATLAAGSGFTSQRSCPVSPAPVPACTNGVDDDGDGAIDFPADSGCTSATDTDEEFDCLNGLDDDGDGAIDAADAGCNLSQLGVEDPQCQDGIDNDGDGAIDFPTDTLCRGAWDPDESTNPASCGLLGPELLLVLAALRLRSRAKR